MQFTLYPNFKLKQNNGVRSIDLDGATIKLALFTSSYTPSASDDLYSGISADEVSGTGYTAGGQAVDNKTLTLSGNDAVWAFDDEVFAQNAAGFTNARRAVLYDDTTGGLIAYSGAEASDMSAQAGPVTIDVGASGIGSFTG